MVRGSARGVTLLCSGVLAAWVGVWGCSAPTPAPGVAAPVVAPASASAEIFPQVEGAWSVWWRGSWPGRDVRLTAVDAAGERAVVWLAAHHPEARLAVEEVRLGGAGGATRWEATPAQAAAYADGYPIFRPLRGTVAEDVRRLGSLVALGGPWTTRSREVGPLVVPGPVGGWVVYGAPPEGRRDGEWLMVLGPEGAPRRLDVGMVASYAPSFSPDGAEVAFAGCSPRHAARGRDCTYQLFVAPVAGGAPEHVPVGEPRGPVWSGDGGAVLAVGTRGGRRCLWRASRGAWERPEALHCPEGLEEVGFALDPSGSRAVVGGLVSGSAPARWRYVGITLADGAAAWTHEVEGAVGVGSPGPGGYLVGPLQGGRAFALDVASGAVQQSPAGGRTLVGFEAARWRGEAEVFLLRRGGGRYEVVSWRLR